MLKNMFSIAMFILSITAIGADFRVGIGRKIITPQEPPIWMGGYASRTKPAEGVYHDIWAKALVIESSLKNKIESSLKNKIVIVTMDLHKFSRQMSEDITKQITKKYGIERSQLILNVSHSHSGPMIWPNADMLDFKPVDQQAIFLYSQEVINSIVEIVGIAIKNLEPGQLSSGHGEAFFGKNRRDSKLLYRPEDQDVPVLKIETFDGTLKAVLFGYACHNTTLGGNNYQISGDYAGFAQIELEKSYPGTTAMFFQGCGGDINPQPSGNFAFAEQNGLSLANAVKKVLSEKLAPVRPPIRSDYEIVNLDFKPFDLDLYQKQILSTDRYIQRRAKLMLLAFNNDWDLSKFAYPVQAVHFNNDLTFLALGGEVVVDYSLLIKKMYPNENMFIAGYCNEVICYIPSSRVLNEEGYEPVSSMVYYVLPGPFDESTESKVISAIKSVLKNVGVKSRAR
jgi:hypothetical protein